VIVAGRHAILEALRGGSRRLTVIHIDGGAEGRIIAEITQAALRAGVPVREAVGDEIERMAPGVRHQGVVAETPAPSEGTLPALLERIGNGSVPALVVVLDELTDPQNVGAIVRTAECAGAHGVVITANRSAPVGPGVENASAGAVEHLPPVRVTSLRDALEKLKRAGCWIIGADTAGEKVYTEADFRGPVALVLGAEGEGLRRLTKETCDELVRIPLLGKIASLNVSAAAAVLCYEAVRQRAGGKPAAERRSPS
jgi:23S rRNA (guanosine2251-2'-O)-methyltransferase